MHKDFHLYGTYLAARLAGRSAPDSRLIACAAQATDDFTYGAYSTCMTNFDTFKGNLDVSTTCWSIFHFLPGGIDSGLTDDRKYITKPSGLLYNLLYAEASSMVRMYSGIALAKIGIICHIIADTYAHQDFSGQPSELNIKSDLIMCDKINLSLRRNETIFVPKMLTQRIKSIRIGHGSAGTAPDLSWISFKYKEPQGMHPDTAGDVFYERDNAVIFADAFAALYAMLKDDSSDAPTIQNAVEAYLAAMRADLDESKVESYGEDKDTSFFNIIKGNQMLPKPLNIMTDPFCEMNALNVAYDEYIKALNQTASQLESTSDKNVKKRLLFDTNDFLAASLHIRSEVLTEIYHV